ncbi:uncharacterized protein LOC135395709 [Ornithodoros turicata]|uniref:uncharacterized protein LOC135395709 n=1 Tax=Ornithodoros turicata TaxID=34597 RepID=UPI003139C133
MRSVHISLNVQKCAVLLFTPSSYPSSPVTIDLKVASESIRQTNLLKYLGVWYEGHLDWAHHLEVVSQKATKACSLLYRCSSTRIGMRRNALLLVYKCYIRPVLEFGCVLFSHLPDYRLRRLFIIERKALRLCLGLPKYTSNQALYCEARILPLKSRFRVLTINTFLSLCQSPLSLRHNEALRDMRYWLDRRWRKSNTPQLAFAELLLKPLGVSLTDVPPPCCPLFCPSVKVEDAFQPGTSFTDHNKLEVILNRHIDRFPEHLVVATDASVSGQRAGVGLVFPRLDGHFPIRLPDYIPVFESEFLAIVLALRMVPARYCKTLLLSDSLSVISSLANPSSPLLQLLASLTPPHISEVVLTWIPGHKGLTLNEAADSLAKISLTGPIIDTLPPLPQIVKSRYRRFLELSACRSLPPRYDHLSSPWQPDCCSSRLIEVFLTRARCLALPLNFYLHRAGVHDSPLCPHCGQDETVEHFFLHCRLYDRLRQNYLVRPLKMQGAPLCLDSLLSFGSSHAGRWNWTVASSVAAFMTLSQRF